MNVSRRRYMGEKGGSPSYQRIEYLESTGTQYILSNILPSINFDIECKVNILQGTNFRGLLGCVHFITFNSNCYFSPISVNNSNTYYIQVGDDYSYTYSSKKAWAINVIHAYGKNNIQYLDVDNVTVSKSISGIIPDIPIYIFARNKDGVINGAISAKIYYLKMYKNNVLVLDLIPVRIGQVGYLYDEVSGELFGNLGTGDFILGPDIN